MKLTIIQNDYYCRIVDTDTEDELCRVMHEEHESAMATYWRAANLLQLIERGVR